MSRNLYKLISELQAEVKLLKTKINLLENQYCVLSQDDKYIDESISTIIT